MSLTERLREATRPHHDRIERAVNLVRPGGVGLDEVGWVLRAFHGYHAAWEPRVAEALPGELGEFFAPRRKVGWLEEDLAALGVAAQLDGDGRAATLPELTSPARALGSMYVMEGSTLGGQVIDRQLRSSAGFSSRYFASYGDRVGEMWRSFKGVLCEYGAGREDDVIESARQTFDTLHDWMNARAPAGAGGNGR